MEEALLELKRNTADFWVPREIKRIPFPATASEFQRDYVATSTPVIITGALEDWPARDWDVERLRRQVADRVVHVNVTPDGWGDSVQAVEGKEVFIKPEEREVPFGEFCEWLECPDSAPGIPYLSHQNDSLRQELPELAADVPEHGALQRLGHELFGPPDAVNLWIGDDRAVSAVHKDHYENMYAVLQGEKTFTLLPPSDCLFLHEADFPSARWTRDGQGTGQKLHMEEGETVSWIPLDPADETEAERYPLFAYASPVQCTVAAGEVLFLPSLWYHRVAQTGITIAVNHWFDQSFGHSWVYYKFLKSLAAVWHKQPALLGDKSSA